MSIGVHGFFSQRSEGANGEMGLQMMLFFLNEHWCSWVSLFFLFCFFIKDPRAGENGEMRQEQIRTNFTVVHYNPGLDHHIIQIMTIMTFCKMPGSVGTSPSSWRYLVGVPLIMMDLKQDGGAFIFQLCGRSQAGWWMF